MKPTIPYQITVIFLATITGITLPAIAQETNNTISTDRLSPVTVTADYTTGVSDTITVTNKLIEDIPLNNARDLLRNIPSVTLENSAIEDFSGVRIRGMGGAGKTNRTGQNRVVLNVDGISLPDTFRTGHATRIGLAPIEVSDLKQINIIRGPETSTQGKSGLAGTLNFITKDPEDYYDKNSDKPFGGNVRTGYNRSDNNFYLGATAAGQITDTVAAMISYTHHKSGLLNNYNKVKPFQDNGSFMAFSNPDKLADRIDSANITVNNVMGKIVFSPNANHRFTFKVGHNERDFKASLLSNPAFASMRQPKANYIDKNKGKLNLFSIRHDFVIDASFADDGYWQVFYQHFNNHRDNDLAYGVSHGATNYEVSSFGAELNLSKSFSSDKVEHTLNYGVNLQQQKTKVRWLWDAPSQFGGKQRKTYQPDTKTQQITAYVNDDITLPNGKLHIIPGIEVTHYTLHPSSTEDYATTLTKLSDTNLSWRLGTSYDVTDTQQLFASYRQGYRLPSFAEMNSSSGHNGVPNPNIKPEQSTGIALGLRSYGEIGSQTISAFYDIYSDLIVQGKTPNGDSTEVNMEGKVNIYGIEYHGELDLHHTFTLPTGMKLRTTLAYVKGKNKETNAPYSAVEPFSGNFSFAYDTPSKRWGAAATVNFASAKKAKNIAKSDTTLFPIAGYGVTDLTAYFKPIKGMKINIGIYNLFNKKYAKWSEVQHESTFPQRYDQITEPGRFFGANLRYDF
ncbi:MAG: TonB-dependent receptor domain-containing protein [Ostreibacterium sp.]